jgi:serine protease Do
MQVWRKGVTRDLVVVVAEIPAEEKTASRSSRSAKPAERAANRLGLVVSELTTEQKRELKLDSGLLVEDVRNVAARAELRPGDILLALIARGETIELKSVEQFNRLLAQLDKSASVTLLVRRGELQTFVTLKAAPEKRGE